MRSFGLIISIGIGVLFALLNLYGEVEVVENSSEQSEKLVGLRNGKMVFEQNIEIGGSRPYFFRFYLNGEVVVSIIKGSDGTLTITHPPHNNAEATIILDAKSYPSVIYLLDASGNVIDGAKMKGGILTPIELGSPEEIGTKDEVDNSKTPNAESASTGLQEN